MKLWLVHRTDSVDYDEYSSLVLRAESREAALDQLRNPNPDGSWRDEQAYRGMCAEGSNVTIEELTAEGEPGLVIEDYLRG